MKVTTKEGEAPIRELIKELESLPKLEPFVFDKTFKDIACAHVKDQGATSQTGHTGTTGETFL